MHYLEIRQFRALSRDQADALSWDQVVSCIIPGSGSFVHYHGIWQFRALSWDQAVLCIILGSGSFVHYPGIRQFRALSRDQAVSVLSRDQAVSSSKRLS